MPASPAMAMLVRLVQAQVVSCAPTRRAVTHWPVSVSQLRMDLSALVVAIQTPPANTPPTTALGWSLPTLRREWNQAKHEVALSVKGQLLGSMR
jgi:hypothetical protein